MPKASKGFPARLNIACSREMRKEINRIARLRVQTVAQVAREALEKGLAVDAESRRAGGSE